MNPFLQLFLSILTAMGGFVEIGEVVFSVNAGAKFGFSLLWVIALGTLGIIVYGEMAGRVAAVAKQPVFYLVRERCGFRVGLGTLIAANIVSILTCTAEIGGVALILRQLTGLPYRLVALLGALGILAIVWFFAFKWIERFFGLLGLLMITFAVAAICLEPDWGQVAAGLVPNVPALPTNGDYLVYGYFAVTLLSSVMLPYETYFYASGAIEDGWDLHEVRMNRIIVPIGFILGSVLGVALVIIGAQLLQPARVEPEWPGSAALGAAATLGRAGVLMGLLGMLLAFSGAAVENALTAAYNLAHFLGWPWGKFRKPAGAPRFTLAWIAVLLLALLVILAGVNPVQIVEYSVVFSVVILPLTYLPLLMAGGDAELMGPFKNGPISNTLGWFFLVLVTLAGLAAIPLLILTHAGKI